MQADIRWGVRRHRLASVRHPCRGRIRHRARRLFTARWCEARARLPGDAPAGRIVCGRRLCDDTSVLTLPYLPAYSIIMIALYKVAAPRLDRTAKAADEVAAYERIDSTMRRHADSSSGGGSRATMTRYRHHRGRRRCHGRRPRTARPAVGMRSRALVRHIVHRDHPRIGGDR